MEFTQLSGRQKKVLDCKLIGPRFPHPPLLCFRREPHRPKYLQKHKNSVSTHMPYTLKNPCAIR